METEHQLWLEAYHEQVALTQSEPYDDKHPARLSDVQVQAYLTLPDLLDMCKSSWESAPPEQRSPHYLMDQR